MELIRFNYTTTFKRENIAGCTHMNQILAFYQLWYKNHSDLFSFFGSVLFWPLNQIF